MAVTMAPSVSKVMVMVSELSSGSAAPAALMRRRRGAISRSAPMSGAFCLLAADAFLAAAAAVRALRALTTASGSTVQTRVGVSKDSTKPTIRPTAAQSTAEGLRESPLRILCSFAVPSPPSSFAAARDSPTSSALPPPPLRCRASNTRVGTKSNVSFGIRQTNAPTHSSARYCDKRQCPCGGAGRGFTVRNAADNADANALP